MLKRKYRVRRRRDFAFIYRRGKTAHAATFSIRYMKNNLTNSRVAVVASTKVSKKAVVRNRIRRRLYNQIGESWGKIESGNDIIILPRHEVADLPADELQKQLLSCLQSSNLLH